MKLRAIALAAALAVVGTACGDDSDGEISTPGGTDGDAPADGDEILVQVATSGGYVPVENALGQIPEITIYGDGRIVTIGPTTEQFPPNALPNLLIGELDADQIADDIAAAEDAGFLGDEPPEYGTPEVTDLPSTEVTVTADGERRSTSAYGLGYDEDAGLSDDEQEAREELLAFIEGLPTDDADREYEPDALAVFALPYEVAEPVDDGDDPQRVEWPLGALEGEPVEGFGADAECVLVEGDDVTTVLDAADGVGSTARWQAGDAEYTLVFRPLLPHESACPFVDDDAPTGEDAETLLVQIDLGDNAWVGNPVTQLPEVSVYGDGRIVVHEADPDSSASTAIPDVAQYLVGSGGVDLIIEAAEEAGLLDDEAPDYGEPGITDQGTTVVRLDLDGTERTLGVYALDLPVRTETDADDLGLDDDQVEAREALAEFIEQVSDPEFFGNALMDEGTFEPTAFAVVYRPFDPEYDDAGYDPVTWPLGDLAAVGEPFERFGDTARCAVVEGDDVATLLEAAAGSSLETPWESGGTQYRVTFRPLLPDESTCTDVSDRPSASGGGA